MLYKTFKQYIKFSPSLYSLSHVLPRYITEASFHLKHIHLKPAAASSLLAVPAGLKETGQSYAYFVCLPKGKFGAELESRGNF